MSPSLCLKVTLETGNFTVSRISENVGCFMPDYTFPKINIWYAINTQTLDVDCRCKTLGKAKNLHIVVKLWPLKAPTTTYCVICDSEDGFCLCQKAPKESLRVRLPQWARKTIDLTLFFLTVGELRIDIIPKYAVKNKQGFDDNLIEPGYGEAVRHKCEDSQWKGMVLPKINTRTPTAIWVLSGRLMEL